MRENDKIRILRTVKKLKESLTDVRHVFDDDPLILKAKRDIEEAITLLQRSLVKDG